MTLTKSVPILIQLNGTEQSTRSMQFGLANYLLKILYFSGDTNIEIIVRVYILDTVSGTRKKYLSVVIQNFAELPVHMINWVTTSEYEVTVELLSGNVGTIFEIQLFKSV